MIDAPVLAGFAAALARASALVYTAPVVGDRTVPGPVKAVVAAAIAAATVGLRGPIDPDALVAVIPFEVAVGLVAGLSARMLLVGADTGGQLIGLQAGIGMAGQIDPAVGDDALPTRRMVAALAALAFLALGGLDAVVRVVASPPPSGVELTVLAAELPARAGEALILGARIAAPLVLASTIVSLALALASRGAPSVNIFSLDLGLRAAVAVAVLIACAPALVGEVLGAARRAADVMEAMSP